MVQRIIDLAALDSFRLQLSPECSTGKVATLLAGGDPANCKRGVVDQAYLFETIKYYIDRGWRHILVLKCLVKLLSGASLGSQLAQCDGAGYGFDIGVDIL
jgi:hypothetical protein